MFSVTTKILVISNNYNKIVGNRPDPQTMYPMNQPQFENSSSERNNYGSQQRFPSNNRSLVEISDPRGGVNTITGDPSSFAINNSWNEGIPLPNHPAPKKKTPGITIQKVQKNKTTTGMGITFTTLLFVIEILIMFLFALAVRYDEKEVTANPIRNVNEMNVEYSTGNSDNISFQEYHHKDKSRLLNYYPCKYM